MTRMWKDFECADCWRRHSTKTYWDACHKGCPHCGGTLVPLWVLGHYDVMKPDDAPEPWWDRHETVDKILDGPPDMAKRYEENVKGRSFTTVDGVLERLATWLQDTGERMQDYERRTRQS